MRILFFLLFASSLFSGEKILICGVGKNIAPSAKNVIQNAEGLGKRFEDYAVIIYENNSTDGTANIFSSWAKENSKVLFLSETLGKEQPACRTEKIARARNIVLERARAKEFQDFSYLIMVDLDFNHEWPIDEIVKTIVTGGDWDCVTANSSNAEGMYYDRYALRTERFPFGPELLDNWWWSELVKTKFSIPESADLLPVYSAFGGLAIYKTKSLLPFSYSGTVTDDLKTFYRNILNDHPKTPLHLSWLSKLFQQTNPHIKRYLRQIKKNHAGSDLAIYFVENTKLDHPAQYEKVTCCEHVALHASMTLHGHGKIFINPRMTLKAY